MSKKRVKYQDYNDDWSEGTEVGQVKDRHGDTRHIVITDDSKQPRVFHDEEIKDIDDD